MSHLLKPKVRNISVNPTVYQGQPVFILHDALRLTEQMIALPQFLGPLVMMCDGQHTITEMRSVLAVQHGLELPEDIIEGLLKQFDEALLLEGGQYETVRQQRLSHYRQEAQRPAALAGSSYPAQPSMLRAMFHNYLLQAEEVAAQPAHSRAIISPHIDYQRGGPVYAKLWASAQAAVQEAELVIILATDHNGGPETLTLTPQNYASPLGMLPTDVELVTTLAELIGPEAAYAEEIHHINEHSIELVFVWLQFIRELAQTKRPCTIVPILCGSFHHYMVGLADISENETFTRVSQFLREQMQKRRTLIVASGDLAHMGPAFGDAPLDAAAHAQMQVDDERLLQTLSKGNAQAFFEFMQDERQYRRNVCGLAPFYFTLDLLEQSRGHLLSYDRCSADEQDSSFVSICGMVLE